MKEKRTRKNDDDIAIVLYNHCVMSFCDKTIAFFIIMLFSRPYMWIDNLLTCITASFHSEGRFGRYKKTIV
jgi:hypothetical protein